jgi:hypothetical protein
MLRQHRLLPHLRAARLIPRRAAASGIATAVASIPGNPAGVRAVNAAVTATAGARRDAVMMAVIAIGVTTTGIRSGASGIGIPARVPRSLR